MDFKGPENRRETSPHKTWDLACTCNKRVKNSSDARHADSIIPDGVCKRVSITWDIKTHFPTQRRSHYFFAHYENQIPQPWKLPEPDNPSRWQWSCKFGSVRVCLFYHHFVLRVEYFHINPHIISQAGYCELPDTLRKKWKFCQEIIPPKICRLANFIISIMSFYLEGFCRQNSS